MKVAIAVI